MTYVVAADVLRGGPRLLPRVGTTACTSLLSLTWEMASDAGGGRLGQSRFHLAAVVS